MPSYRYWVTTYGGFERMGSVEASSRDEAVEKVKELMAEYEERYLSRYGGDRAYEIRYVGEAA